MPRIFISYRRTDSKPVADRIHDRLVNVFGERDVFEDVSNIPVGKDFPEIISKAANECRVMLVVIGSTWISVTDKDGERRLDNPNDFVRSEIEIGLRNKHTKVIPLLINGTAMPSEDELPTALRELASKQAFFIRFDPHDDSGFRNDLEALIGRLPPPRPKWKFPLWLSGITAFLLIALGLIVLRPILNQQTPTQTVSITATTNTPVFITATVAGSLGFPGNPVTSNVQWTPYIDQYGRQFDAVEMALVPVGCFQMGDASDSNVGAGGKQCFNQPFWIDRYEVTNEQFNLLGGQAVRASGYTNDNQPREIITWSEAHDFCQQKRGGFLPTEAEWEYAARGPDNLIYPWGNYLEPGIVVSGSDQPADVGSNRADVSWVGVDDMTGNVMEWVSTVYDGFAYPYATDDGRESITDNNAHVIRGGMSGNSLLISFRVTYRHAGNPDYWFGGLGFRCARAFSPGDLDH